MSRLALPDIEVNDYEEEVILFLTTQISDSTVTLSEVQVATAEDPILANISKFVQNGWLKKSKIDSNWLPYFNIREELTVIKDILMRDERVVVPAGLTTQLIHIVHQGHQGMTRTKQRLRQYYWWSSMDKQVEELIRNCVVCSSSSDKTAKTYTAPMTPISFPDEPWKKISMDIVGPMDTLPYDCRYAVTLVDLHSKWPKGNFRNCYRFSAEGILPRRSSRRNCY